MFAGIAAAAIGLLLILVAFGAILADAKMKPDESWIGAVAGAAFVLAGLTIILQTLAAKPTTPEGELPPDAPLWIRLMNYFFILAIIALLAGIASWVAFGAGERTFSGFASILPYAINDLVGRTVFGAAAIITWLILIVVAVVGARRLRRPNPSP